MSNERTKASEEQITYANILNKGMWFGLALLIITFMIYVTGVLPSHVPIADLSKTPPGSEVPYWSMRAHDFNQALNIPTGWGWVALAGKGDYLNFIGIAILAGLTVLCYLAILPILIRKKETPYVIIAIVEIAVLALAASGILKTGGH